MSTLALFEEKQVRRAWNQAEEKWYFAIVDVVAILTGSVDAGAYWRKLKECLKNEGNKNVTNCHALKMTAADGKRRLTDVADTGQLLRLIQSIPSPKAEPFKLWLAKVGHERLEEIENPELAARRVRANYRQKAYSDDSTGRPPLRKAVRDPGKQKFPGDSYVGHRCRPRVLPGRMVRRGLHTQTAGLQGIVEFPARQSREFHCPSDGNSSFSLFVKSQRQFHRGHRPKSPRFRSAQLFHRLVGDHHVHAHASNLSSAGSSRNNPSSAAPGLSTYTGAPNWQKNPGH